MGQGSPFAVNCCLRVANPNRRVNRSLEVETVRLDFQLGIDRNRAKAALLRLSHPAGRCSGIGEIRIGDYLSNVNTCVYEPSAFRVLVSCPRAPMYLPVPPKIGRTTGWPAANSPAVGE